MPINRTYHCPECNYRMEVELTTDQWDAPPPSCASCDAREMNQEFKPPAIGGSLSMRAHKVAEDIIENDYGVADINFNRGAPPKVRYKDQTPQTASAWQGGNEMLQQAISIGKQTRREHGPDGLDILKRSLADGTQPDLIEASKRRAIKVY